MALKSDIVYSRGMSDDEHDQENVPKGSRTLTITSRVTLGNPKKVAFGVVTSFHCDEESTPIGPPFRSTLCSKRAFGSKEALDS